MNVHSYQVVRALAACALVCLLGSIGLQPAAFAQRGALLLEGEGYAQAADDDSLDLGSESMTVEAWIRHDGQSDENAIVVTKSDGSSIDYEISFVGAGEEVPVRFYIYSENYYAESAVGVPAHQWTHVAGTYDGNEILIYVNGELQDTRNTSGASLLTDTPLSLGANTSGNSRFYSGMIDEVRIWNEVRSASNIASTMYGELDGGEPGLLAYYTFDTDGSDAVGDKDLSLDGDAEIAAPGVYPVAPNLYAAAGNSSVVLTWAERLGEGGENDAAQFKIYRATESDLSDRQEIATVSDGTSYTDNAVTNGTTYHYQITSINAAAEESDYSYAVVTTPYATGGGGSLSMSGSGYAVASHRPSLSLGSEDLTVEAWIRHDGTSDADAVILTKSDGSSIDYELSLVGSGEEVPVRFSIYSENYFAESTVGVAANQWTHVAGTYDGDVITIYVNGEVQDTRNTSGPTLATETPLTFGANTNGNGRFFSGMIDEVRIWDEARPLFELEGDYRSRLTGNEEGLRAYYAFDTPGSTQPQGYLASGPGTLSLVGDAAVTASGVHPLPPHTFVEPQGPSALVSWIDRNESSAEFNIYRSTQADGSDRQLLTTVDGSVTSYTDANLNVGTTYFYQVSSVNAAGQESDFASYAPATAAADRDGNALQVGGTGGFATVPHRASLQLANESMTVEAWIKHDGESDADAVILTKRDGDEIDYELSLVGSGEEVPVRFYFYSPNYYAESDVTVPAGVWTHVAGTYDGSTLSIYIDGELQGTRSTSGASLAPEAPLTIGANTNGNGRFFSGLIDEVRIWDVVRTVLELRQTRLSVLTGDEEGLRAYFRFDETSGTTAYGSTRNAMTAELEGTATFTASQSPVPVEEGPAIPESFVLDGNYPNPFNPQTMIRFGLNAPSVVRLTVFDLTGRQIAVLVNDETRTAGWHEVPFNAAGLPSGVYMYRVQADHQSHVGQMMIVK